MPRLLYISNARLPSLMAHGLQIVQNCEAFAENGADVTLWCASRFVPAAERQLGRDIWQHYGIKRNFKLRRLPTLDLTFLTPKLFLVQYATFALIAALCALFTAADLYYSRDPLILLLLSFIKPRQKLVYEAHRLNRPGVGAWLQRQVLRRCGLTVAITPPLRDRLNQRQAANPVKSQIIVAHDGIRPARFENVPPQGEARTQIGWASAGFIVGYVGRLRTLGMDKGLDILIDAIGRLPAGSVSLAIVGGPESMVDDYRQRWHEWGLPEDRFLCSGQVAADQVPRYMSTFDVCAMPYPWQEHFAYDTSPMKLFEYMASGRAIVASDLPAYADVLRDDENALLVPPSEVEALAAAIERLQTDAELRSRLAASAYRQVLSDYTWSARAKAILAAYQRLHPAD